MINLRLGMYASWMLQVDGIAKQPYTYLWHNMFLPGTYPLALPCVPSARAPPAFLWRKASSSMCLGCLDGMGQATLARWISPQLDQPL